MQTANLEHRPRFEYRRAHEEEVPHRSESVKIRSSVNCMGIHDGLRCHVKRSTRESVDVAARLVDAVELAHEPEVEQLGDIGAADLSAEHDVSRFDVAVNEPNGVRL